MYKKLLLSSMAVMAVSGLSAKHLTPQEALSRAMSQPASGLSKSPAAASMAATRTLVTSDNTEALYLFEGDGGDALIVPADDRIAPVLGYIDGKADGCLPPQMEWWLSEYVRQIEYVMSRPENGTGLYITLPARAASSDKAPIAPMLTTSWDQSSPYNYNCPTVDGSKAMTGCVATAAAQIMKYHNYPAEGSGTISYKDDNSGTTRTLALDGKPFDWDNMLDSYSGFYNTTQRNAVAFLMQAVGYASEMSYGAELSGALSPTMVEGVKKYFGYNENMTILERQNFPLAQWEDLIYENLQKVGPVYYAGSDKLLGGHAFVCDGYSSDGYYHFNWGWGGAYDGYFKLTALTPEGQGIGGNAGGFNFGQEIALNFTRPDAATIDLSTISPITLVGNMTAEQDSRYDLLVSSDQAASSGVFFYNASGATVNVELGLKAVNTATGEETIQGEGSSISFKMYQGLDEMYLPIPEDLPDGNYRMYLVAHDYPAGEWIEVNHDIACVNYVNVTITNGVIASVNNETGGQLEVSNLEVLTSIYMGYPIKLSYTVENNSQTEIYDGISPVIFTISNGQADPKGIADAFAADMTSGQSQDVETIANLYAYQGSSSFSGEAYLGLVSQNTGEILTYVPVTVNSRPASLSAKSTEFSMAGDKNGADANNLQFTCGVEVTRGYWASPLTVYICNTSTGSLLHTLSSSETYFLNSGQSATNLVSGNFPTAEEGKSYNAIFGYVSGYYIIDLDVITFKVGTPYSGIEETASDAGMQTVVIADRSADILSVIAPSDIASVELFSIDGRRLASEMAIDGTSAGTSLSALPAGILLVKVTLADGTTTTAKIVR